MRTVKLTYVRRLVKAIDAGHLSDDGANSLSELKVIVESLMKCSQDVVSNWQHGDLAGAVNMLREHLGHAEGRDERG